MKALFLLCLLAALDKATAAGEDFPPLHPRATDQVYMDRSQGPYDRLTLDLRIVNFTLAGTETGGICSGRIVIKNFWGKFSPPIDRSPAYEVMILNSKKKQIFRNMTPFVKVGPPMKNGEETVIVWNTNRNEIGNPKYRPFKIPGPGEYELRIVLYESNLERNYVCMDVQSKKFTVH